MLGGERRWAPTSTRRSGMTVLGKVVVPKPVNLPSQRSENHGLDPRVEIVPKGTHSWGSRSSSSTSNAWSSSVLSPRNDGRPGSPSYLSGRPSSGGSGTRPSTASSDRAHEPTASAWGANSRPSSASGALTSNQTSLTSLRPRSAETRPGSSQLSRFAESLPENPGAWGAAGTAEKLGVTAAKNDGFSLTSGDFPTLGSEKDNSVKNESQDHGSHGRPGSSSGEVGPPKERNGTSIVGDVSVNVDVKIGTANSWRRDSPPYSEDGVTSSVERWQGNPQPYPNPSIPPQHYEAWHGPPVTNPPGGVWFRGPPGGPPYGAPVAPGGFPMEPYSYYRPHIPPALANPQPGPPPGGRPRGHHPKNGDMYRPHMPDAYIRPGMPIRPGFYPGPVAYEGYYGGPMGYCSSNERDVPFMGMSPGTSVYNNRYPNQNAPEPTNSQGRSGGYSSTGKTLVSEHVESGHPNDNQGPYKVLLKQQNGWDGKNEEKKWEDTTTTNATYVEKGDQTEVSSWENDWRSDYRNNGEMGSRRMVPGQEISSQTYDDQQSHSSVPVKVKSPESTGNLKAFDDSSARNLERPSSGLSEVRGPVSVVPKDSTLIRKIEGLNAKVRASDGQDITSITGWEEQKNKIHVHNTKANHSKNEGGSGFVHTERTHAAGIMNPASHEMGVSTGDKSLESTAAGGTTISRRSTHGMQGRSGNHGKGGINSKEADSRHKKIRAIDSPSVVSTSRFQTNSNVHVHDRHTSEASEKSGPYPQAREEKESAPPVCDPSDYQVQRMKLRELEQRAKQLREEEEERTRKQKARALAKLEDLDRRKHSNEGSMHKSENASCVAIQNKQELNVVPRISEGNTSRDEQFPVLSSELPPEKPKSTNEEPIVHKHSVSLQQDADSADVAYRTNAPHVHDGNVSKHKSVGYKQKKNLLPEKSSNEKSTFASTNEAPNSEADAVRKVAISIGGFTDEIALNCKSSLSVNENAVVESTRLPVNVNSVAESSSFPVNPNAVAESSSMPMNSNAAADSSINQRKKNRSGKNKHKVEAASSMAALPLSESKETNLVNASLESGRPMTSETELDPNLIQSVTISEDANQLLEHHSSLSSEDSHGRGSNSQWKSQHSRRMARNPQVNRSAEKFHGDVIWAPVRSQNKADTDETSQKIVDEAITPSMKSEHQVQSNPKNKRAEIERYVPKPVAKEMAQQGSIQQPVAFSINHSTYDETVGRADSSPQGTESTEPAGSGAGKVGPALEPRNGDGKQNKQGKAHGSWRQRVSTESVSVQSMHDGPSSHPGRNAKKLIEDYQPQKPDVSSVKEQPKYSDEQNAPDGQKAPDNSDSVASVGVTVVKDQVVTGRVKRHPFKGQKGMGHNNDLDHKRINSGDTSKINTQSSALEMSQTDLPIASKETRGIGERSTAHWQPKSQSFSANNQQGSKSNSGRSVGAGAVWTNKKENTPQGVVPQAPQHSEGVSQPRHDQSPSEKSDAEEALNVGYQEATRGRKVGSFKGRPLSPSHVPVGPVEHAPASMDVRHEQRSSSGFRRSANQNNNRFDRGHESRGDWNSSGQESKHLHVPVNWERQRHNAHYEYQPVGPYNNNKSNNAEGLKDGTHNTGSRFRERGQIQSRRGGGNFYGQQRSNDRVDAGYE